MKNILKKLIERGEKCEKLVLYQAKSFAFNGIDAKTPMLEIDLKGFSSQTQLLHAASLHAQILDDFQYLFCEELKKTNIDREYARIISIFRIIIIASITQLRQIFIFINNQTIEKLLPQLNEALNEMNELIKDLKKTLITYK